MKKIVTLALFCLFVFAMQAQNKGQHHIWNGLLQKYVNDKGEVNYLGFQSEMASLERYCHSLGANPPQAGWSLDEQKAYWLNVYNAFTVKLIVENYPISSIKKISTPWDQPFVVLGGDTMSLNDVENNILRKKYNDPRIHVGINCASISCPKLHNQAFTANNVDALLSKLTTDFLSDGTRNQIFKGEMRLSMVFNWFEGDFTKNGTLIDFINTYSKVKVNKDAFISYIDYNWNLNE